MTPALDLDSIQARVNAATDGPWYADHIDGQVHDSDGRFVAQTTATNSPTPDLTFIAHARVDVEQLLGRVRELAGSLDEMTRCRDAAVRALHRDDIETDIDVEDTIANSLWGPGWDWEDERTPRLIAREAGPAIRPALAKACEQRDQALARVAELEAKRTALEAACDGWAEAGRNEERIWAARVAELEQQLAVAQAATETNREVARVLLSELSANRPPAECGAPHPVADDTRCERQPEHDGWHAATIGTWPTTTLPPLGTSTPHNAR